MKTDARNLMMGPGAFPNYLFHDSFVSHILYLWSGDLNVGFRVRNIMDWMQGELQGGDNLLIRIDRDGSFQESFSRIFNS
ncbi:MAG: hypothetical protein WCX22_06840 [Methanoregula sp.]